MLARLLAALALVAAPEDDAAAKLRVAWASQYEWKEDAVRNVTLDFEYAGSWTGRDDQEFGFRGQGQVVVVDGQVVRRHLPDVGESRSERIVAELDWVIARFVREPFGEEFEGARFGPPEELANGVLKVPVGDAAYLLKDDRLVGMERDYGTAEQPFPVRVEFTTAAVGGGYGVLAERASYTRNMVKTTESRRLTLRKYDAPPPVPQRHVFERTDAGGRLHLEIAFEKPAVNAEDPVVLDAAARDVLKKAWARQYRLPRDIRIEGNFRRELDSNLRRARWTSNVKGRFQVWGLDSIEAVVKESRGGERVASTCLDHLRQAFGLFDVKPFDEEFRGCGFTREDAGDDPTIVRVVGHADTLAYRIEEGLIAGRLETGTGASWWTYDLKELRDGPVLIESMTREVDGEEYELRFRYGKTGGVVVPKTVAVLATPNFGRRRAFAFGVAEYRFTRLKVSLPE